MATGRELLRLAQATATILVTTVRIAVEGRDGTRQEVPLADITDAVVGAAGSGAGAGYAVRVQHWRPGPALVAKVDDEGEARRVAHGCGRGGSRSPAAWPPRSTRGCAALGQALAAYAEAVAGYADAQGRAAGDDPPVEPGASARS